MRAYVHSCHVRPDGDKDSFLTLSSPWRATIRTDRPRVFCEVMWGGRWRPVWIRRSRSPVDGRTIEHHLLRFRAGSGTEATVTFTED